MFRSKIFLKGLMGLLTVVIFYVAVVFLFALPKVNNIVFSLEEKNGKIELEKIASLVNNAKQDLKNFKVFALEKHEQELKNLTSATWSIIQLKYEMSKPENIGMIPKERGELFHKILLQYYDNNKNKLSKQELQNAIKNFMHIYRNNGEMTEYFWANDLNGNIIEHPINPELDGKNVLTLKDSDGIYMFREFIKVCRENGSGIVKYKWFNPASKQAEDKISYVFTFEPFGWVIGTGEYYSVLNKKLKQEVIDIVSNMRYADNNYLFISDYDSKLIAHPHLKDVDMSHVKDVKGNLIVPPMVDIARKKGEGFYSYWWKKDINVDVFSEKLTYAKDFPNWNMVVGTGIYIDDIQQEIAKRKTQLLNQIREIVDTTKIGDTGYLFIFDGNGTIIAHPNTELVGTDARKLSNPSTKHSIFEDITEAGKTSRELYYLWDKPTDKGHYIYPKVSWVKYVSSFNWYVSSSAYIDDINNSSKSIEHFIIVFSIIIFLSTLLFCFKFLQNILTPITNLSKIALAVIGGDFSKRCRATHRNDELGTLSREFNKMVDSMERSIFELDSLVEKRTEELESERKFVRFILDSQENIVITTDGKAMRSVNQAFLKFFNVENIEAFIDLYGVCVCNVFKEEPGYVQKMNDGERWLDYVFNRPNQRHKAIMEKDGKEHIFAISCQEFEFAGEHLKTSVFMDITESEEIQQALEDERKFTRFILDSQNSIVLTTDGKQMRTANKAFFEFYNVSTLEEFWSLHGVCICNTFKELPESGYIQKQMGEEKWLDYVSNRPNQIHKTVIERDGKEHIFAIASQEFEFGGEQLRTSTFTDITESEEIQQALEDERKFVRFILDSQENIVITTDGKAMRSVNQAFLKFFNVENIEAFIDLYGVCVCNVFKEEPGYVQKMNDGERWLDYVFNRPNQRHKAIMEKDGKEHIFAISCQEFEFAGEHLKTSVFMDITESEEIQQALEDERKFTRFILDSQNSIVLTTDGKQMRTANKAFFEFYNVSTLEEFWSLHGVCICNTFKELPESGYIQKQMGEEKWLDYVFSRPNQIHKTVIEKDGKEHIFAISSQEFEFGGEQLRTSTFTDITEEENIQKELEFVYTNLKDSIEYASVIQNSIIPIPSLLESCFTDYFVWWEQKDIVGGDIFLFETLRHEDEYLLLVIDCTGHGVPGAFVTMLIKALEREIVAKISKNSFKVSPAIILQFFNKTMKKLLKQDSIDTNSNVGFDGAVIYINKMNNVLRFAGAQTKLFYVQNNELNIIKGDRCSIGYKKSRSDFTFTETEITLDGKGSFYVATDGVLDQTGGSNGLVFGSNRFSKFCLENAQLPFDDQKNNLQSTIFEYQGSQERKDDITVIGFKL